VHEYLAPCIYEGEGEMLGMAFFKSLVKHHGTRYFEPVGKALHAAGIRRMQPWNPWHLWALRGALVPYSRWLIGRWAVGTPRPTLPDMPSRLREHAEFACYHLQKSALETSATLRKHQLKLADRQCRMSELSGRIQTLLVILCTSLYAYRQPEEIWRDAADVYCTSARNKWLGRRPSDRDFRAATRLGESIAEGGVASIAGGTPDDILMKY